MYMIIDKEGLETIGLVAEHLMTGDVAIMPCDTIYGIVGIVPESEERLRHVKGRPDTKPFIQLLSLSMVHTVTKEPIDSSILGLWPGPLTVIVSDRTGGKTAIRVPADPFLTEVIERVGKPMYSTSVNVSGEPSLIRFDDMVSRFSQTVPVFVRGSADQGTIPSTIIDISVRPYALVRQGALDVNALLGVRAPGAT